MTKMFAIRKMKMQFTNKNTHSKTYYRSMQCHRKLFFYWELGTRAEGPRKFLNLDSLKCHFLDFGGSFDRILMVRKQSFSMIFVMLL